MSPFGRRQNSRNRTPEEREAARREREARRAAREGRPLPPPPEPAEEETWGDVPVFDDNGPVAEDPQWTEPAGEPARAEADAGPTHWVAEESPVDEPQPDAPPEPVAEPVADASPSDARAEPVADASPSDAHAEPVADASSSDARAESAGAAPAEGEERPAWDDTGAWDPHPPAREEPPAEPAPTLGEEMAAVDRGWFDDEDPRPREQPGQETVEWDVLAGRPKERAQQQGGQGGVDSPTVEFDVTAQAPKPPVQRPPASAANGARRFEDADERPVPTRRVRPRSRTLPPPPPPPGAGRRRSRIKTIIATLVIAVLVAAALYLVNALFQPLHDEGTGSVRVTIPQNSSAGEIGDVLEREGVVDSAFFFELRARLAGKDLQAGTFTLKQGMPYGAAIDQLSSQPARPRTISLTIPEGRARRETQPLVEKAGLRGSYLEASARARGFSPRRYGAPRRVSNLEGFLFPATYELEPDATARDLVAKQLAAFERNIDEVSMRRARARNLSTYEVLIIASMVEREATLARERRLISAVIHNRLRQDMPLGIDATIRYATRNWSRPLRESELNIDSPYNTRRRIGLPPTPIGSPGLASIKAAANPANVDYLYYVVKPNGDGAHNFSSTDAEFQRDVEAYSRERARRGGNDPSSSDGG